MIYSKISLKTDGWICLHKLIFSSLFSTEEAGCLIDGAQWKGKKIGEEEWVEDPIGWKDGWTVGEWVVNSFRISKKDKATLRNKNMKRKMVRKIIPRKLLKKGLKMDKLRRKF